MFHKITNKTIIVLFLLAASLFFIQCGERAEETETAFEEEREQLVSNLENLKDDLDERIEELNSRIEDTGDEELIVVRDDLRDNRSDVERAIDDLEDATEDTWEAVRVESEELYERVSTTLNEHSERFQDRLNK